MDHWTRPEQSNTLGPSPPQTYGRPTRLLAAARNRTSSAEVRPGPWPAVTPMAPAAAVVTVVPPVVSWVTSAATDASFGAAALILVISAASRACGALIRIAFPAVSPSDRAPALEPTASTPPRPTVPNPATGTDSVRAPVTRTGLVSDSPSCRPIV